MIWVPFYLLNVATCSVSVASFVQDREPISLVAAVISGATAVGASWAIVGELRR